MTVFANQLLHGYADGHRLLVGSTELPQTVMRALLIHSDAPAGPKEHMALSSLPLPDHRLWALTATWQAVEMPRPGSVWSHTLILDDSAIAGLRFAGGLLDVLRRPLGVGDLSHYRVPLLIPERPVRLDEAVADRVAAAVVMAFYRWPEQSAAVVVPNLEQAETAILAAWEQQWPELRATSSFSARRRLEPDNKNQVQIAVMRARTRPPIPVIDASRELPERSPDWVIALLADIDRPGPLRDFLSNYGPEGARGRADVSLLVELERGFNSAAPKLAFTQLIESYPNPQDMISLKDAALEEVSQLWRGPDEQRLLAAYEYHRQVSWSSLRLGGRLAQLWPEKPTVVIECLKLARDDEQLASDAWRALAARADESMLAYLAGTELELAVELARRRPELLLRRSFWQQSQSSQRALVMAVAKKDGLDPALASVLIEVGNAKLAAELRRQGLLDTRVLAKSIAAQGLSDRTRRTYEQVFGDASEEALHHAMLTEASWVERILAALLGGERNLIVANHSSQLAKHLHQLDEPSQLELATRLLLAKGDKPVSKSVIRVVFPVLHRALVSQSLPEEQWEQLDEILPAGNDWDRAERLRKALLESIKQQKWTDADVAQVIEQAGPGAEKLRELTEKKSDLRKAIDAAWDLITPGW